MSKHHNTALVINMSGGKDSSWMLAELCRKYPNAKKYVVYADTGFEHVKPVSAEEWSRQIAARFGLPLYVVRNKNKTYLQMVERRKMFPSPQYRQCTSDLKRDPINTWIRQSIKNGLISERFVVNCTGIRADESVSRSKQKPLSRNRRLSTAGRRVWNWMPIFRATLAEVLEGLRDREIPLHPVYVYAGGYLRRFSCRVCIFSTDADLHAIRANDPEAFDLVASLEQRIGYTMRPGKSLVQIVSEPLSSQAQYGSEEVPCAG